MTTTIPTCHTTELRPEHWADVARIYAEGIATGNATFATDVPNWDRWDSSHLPAHRFVALSDGEVKGWVATSPVSDRCVYAGVVEDTIYLGAQSGGKGVGKALMDRLVTSTESAGMWTIQTGIFPEN